MICNVGDSNRPGVFVSLMGVDRDEITAPASRGKLRDCADKGESKKMSLHVLLETCFAGVLQEEPETVQPGLVCFNMLSYSFTRLSNIEELP